MNRDTAKRIVIFNHKGGVGKTTLTVNIAAGLSSLGKKILLADTDPQCNLTSYLIEDSVVDDLLDKSDSEKGQTLWSAVKPIIDRGGDARVIRPIETSIENILLIPGDINLSWFEEDLINSWSDCFQRKPRGYKFTTAMSFIINEIARENNIDYVFYDSGPNLGPLNRAIILDCDYFIVPAACDLFSIRALKTLGHTLIKWIQDWQIICKLAPDGLYLFPGKPKFLGYIPQKFKVYGGLPIATYQEMIPKITKNIHSEVVARLREIDISLALRTMQFYKLGQVKDFSTLANEAQKGGLPMWKVQSGDQKQRSEAEKVFISIAKKINEFS